MPRAAISPILAVKLENAGLSTADHWLAMQSQWELAHLPAIEEVRSLVA